MKQLITILCLMLFVSTSQAASINDKQQNQRNRIYNGIQNGELTKPEANRLAKRQAKIEKKERRFKSDGHFSKREKAIIHNDLANSSARIYQQKHDGQSRF